jgi:hypothetical protein
MRRHARQLLPDASHRRLVERLHDHRRGLERLRTIEPVLLHRLDEQLDHVDASARVERRRLELRIQAGLSANQIDGLLPGDDPLPGVLRVEPPAGIQPAYFVQREVVGEPPLRRTGSGRHAREALREDLGDVRRPFQRIVVQADEHVVPCHREILLDEVGSLIDRQLIRGARVFGRVPRGAAMRDELLGCVRRARDEAAGGDRYRGHHKREARIAEHGRIIRADG